MYSSKTIVYAWAFGVCYLRTLESIKCFLGHRLEVLWVYETKVNLLFMCSPWTVCAGRVFFSLRRSWGRGSFWMLASSVSQTFTDSSPTMFWRFCPFGNLQPCRGDHPLNQCGMEKCFIGYTQCNAVRAQMKKLGLPIETALQNYRRSSKGPGLDSQHP